MLSPYHCYHLVEKSPWPFTASMGAMLLTSGFVVYFYSGLIWVTLLGLLVVASTAWQWWRDVSREASFQGLHSGPVQWNMRWGMALFIASEVLFFASFFWAYFHVSLAPPVESGLLWPPLGVNAFNPFGIPLLNTTILLSSGLTVTWAHHALLSGWLNEALGSLTLTIVLGFYFTSLQVMEYSEASFTFADSAYGSCFFLATGFHGLHVLIGTTFLAVCLTRMASGALSTEHHFGFEAAAWYWHFVDVVWIFLFVSIYWWGG